MRSLGWFAAGAVTALVVATVLVVSIRADAAPGDVDSTFVPVSPCRLFDYRPAPNTVGTRTAPLGPGEVTDQQVTGAVGECSGIPADAVAVSMNVTIAAPTAASFLTIYPAQLAATPTASSLNWTAGQGATPNKVDVPVSPDGKIKLYNAFGSVYVLADVVGYYTPSSLRELSSSQPFVATDSFTQTIELTATPAVVEAVTLSAPVAGQVTAISRAVLDTTYSAGDSSAACAIEREGQQASGYGANTANSQFATFLDETTLRVATLAGTRTFDVAAGETITIALYCEERIVDGARIRSATLTALFTPSP